MIVKTNYADVKDGVSITVNDGNKDIRSLYKVVVTRADIQEAVQRLVSNPNVIAFRFESMDLANDLVWLAQTFPVAVGKPIIFPINFKEAPLEQLTYEVFASWAKLANPDNIPNPAIRLVFQCPTEHQDIATVYRVSTEFKHTCFCGGYYLNHTFCNIGCIKESDFPFKINYKTVPVTKGCYCNYADMCSDFHTVDFDNAEIMYTEIAVKANKPVAEKAVKIKANNTSQPKPKKPSKPTTSLFSLGGDMLGGF